MISPTEDRSATMSRDANVGSFSHHHFPFLPSAFCLSGLTPVFAADPRNRLLSPFVATLPKTPSCKSFVCHTCDPLPPAALPPLATRYSSLATAIAFFALCHLLSFHTNTNCPFCNSFVLITIRIARGVGRVHHLYRESIEGRLKARSKPSDWRSPRPRPK